MKLNPFVRCVSVWARTTVVLIVFLIGITILRLFIPGVVAFLFASPFQLPNEELIKPELTPAEQRQRRIAGAQKKILPDGTIHLVTSDRNEVDGEWEYTKNIWDVNDNLLWSGDSDDIPYQYLSWPMRDLMYFGAKDMKSTQRISPVFSQIMTVPVIRFDGEVAEYWRYEYTKRYFVGFASRGRRIGYAGSDGFTDSKEGVKPFEEFRGMTAWYPEDSLSPLLLWQTKHTLYKLDFQKHTVKVVFDAQGKVIDKILMHKWRQIKDYYSDDDTGQYRPAMRVDIDNGEHYLFIRDPNEKLLFKRPKDWDKRYISIAAIKDKIFLKYKDAEGGLEPVVYELREQWEEKYRYRPYKQWVELYEIDVTGTLNLINRFEWTNPARKKRPEEPFISLYRRTADHLGMFSPSFYNLIWQLYCRDITISHRSIGISKDIILAIVNPGAIGRLDRSVNLTNMFLNWAISLLMVCLTFWHGFSRRTSWAGFISWLIFVGVFNLAGLLAYLALNHTAVIKCPVCGKLRGLRQVNCVRCGVELPRPERRKLDLIFNT